MTPKNHHYSTQTVAMADIQDAKFESLGLSKTISKIGEINFYHRHLDKISSTNPLLVLIHGYPQSAYESVLIKCTCSFKVDKFIDGDS
jgi:hypothetical protein